MKSIFILLTLASVFMIASCGPTRVATTSSPMFERDVLYVNSWDLAELNGSQVVLGDDGYSYITFTPGSNRLTGYTGCNYLGGTLSLSGSNNLSFSPVITTTNKCPESNLDVTLVPALRSVDTWSIVNDNLVMYDNGRIIARWTPSDFTNEDLYGSWQLSYVSDKTMPFDVMYPVDKRPTLIFQEDAAVISGTTGFNTYSCPVTLNMNGIAVADCTSTKMACEGPGEAIFLKDIRTINNYTLADDDTLVLFADDNTVMKFTRLK